MTDRRFPLERINVPTSTSPAGQRTQEFLTHRRAPVLTHIECVVGRKLPHTPFSVPSDHW